MSNFARVPMSYSSAVFATLAMLSLVACEDPKTFVPSHTDVYTYDTGKLYESASALYQADYVFVLDYSSSMQSKKNNLLDRMDDFVDMLGKENNDYRIGFVKGNAHGCTDEGCSSKTVATEFVSKTFLEPGTSTTLMDSILNQVSTLGDPNSLPPNTPLLLEAAYKALSAQGSTFLRPSAQLVLVFLSDQDDISQTAISSNRTVNYYKSKFRSLKSSASYVSARAFVAGVTCPVQTSSGSGLDSDKVGQRIADVAKGINGNASEANVVGCVYDDEANMLDALARDVQHYTDRFSLEQAPLNSTLTVRVGDVGVNADGNWRYESGSNEIVFNEASKPKDGQRLQISYEAAYVLKAKPKVDSISVLVNGQALPSGSWTYVESENRIRFTGAVPEGAEIRVNYQAK